MRIKMKKDYGQLQAGKEYKVDSSTGLNLVAMGLADEVVRKPKKAK